MNRRGTAAPLPYGQPTGLSAPRLSIAIIAFLLS